DHGDDVEAPLVLPEQLEEITGKQEAGADREERVGAERRVELARVVEAELPEREHEPAEASERDRTRGPAEADDDRRQTNEPPRGAHDHVAAVEPGLDVAGAELEQLEDDERERVDAEQRGRAHQSAADDRLRLAKLLERLREERERALLRLRLDLRLAREPGRDERGGPEHRDRRRPAARVRIRVEEPVEPSLEGQRVAEREHEVGEGAELEAQLARSPGEPGEERSLDRPGIGEAGAREEVGESDRADGEARRAEEHAQPSRAGPDEESGRECAVGERRNPEDDALAVESPPASVEQPGRGEDGEAGREEDEARSQA